MGEATNKIRTDNWNEAEPERQGSTFASESGDDYEEDTELIRGEIEDTRAEMSQTINEIQERLSPENLMGQVKETVREATLGKVERAMSSVGESIVEVTEPAREVMGRAGTTIKEAGITMADTVWKNPIPMALIGLGLGMLAMRRMRSNGYDYEGSETSLMPERSAGQYGLRRGQHSTEGTLGHVKETASELASRSTETLNNVANKAKERASAFGTRFGEVMRENPLAVGAVAVAAGTAVGLMLPSTRLESEYLGETSGMLVDKAEEVARGALDKVQNVAQQVGQQ